MLFLLLLISYPPCQKQNKIRPWILPKQQKILHLALYRTKKKHHFSDIILIFTNCPYQSIQCWVYIPAVYVPVKMVTKLFNDHQLTLIWLKYMSHFFVKTLVFSLVLINNHRFNEFLMMDTYQKKWKDKLYSFHKNMTSSSLSYIFFPSQAMMY